MASRGSPHEQDELFAHFQDMETPKTAALPVGDPESVSAIEPHLLLLNALGNLREASRLNGYVSISLGNQVPGDVAAAQKIERAKAKRGNQTSEAQTHFDQAAELLKAQGVTTEELKELGIGSLSAFITNYYGTHKHTANIAFARLVKDEAQRRMSDPEISVSQANRAQGRRPHKSRPKPKDRELQQLDTTEKLQALQDDSRAGFLPATNKEKTQVMAFLDYLDNPKYPLGINNQFFEIVNHQEREKEKQGGAIPGGLRSVESIVYEFGDYFTQSAEQLVALQDLEAKIFDCPNPRVTLTEEVGVEHPAYGVLARYLDLVALRERGLVDGVSDPLRTKHDRWARSDDPGKHKKVHDQYTAPAPSPVFAQRIQATAASLSVGEMRSVIRDAVTDQTNRHNFMRRRLQDATHVTYSPKYAPKWVHEAERLLKDQVPVLV